MTPASAIARVPRRVPATLKIVIGPDVSCRVRVADQAGQGIPGIRIALLTGAAAELASGVSDSVGLVDLRAPMESQGLLRGTLGGLACRVSVRGPGLARHEYPATPAADGVVQVVLPPFLRLACCLYPDTQRRAGSLHNLNPDVSAACSRQSQWGRSSLRGGCFGGKLVLAGGTEQGLRH